MQTLAALDSTCTCSLMPGIHFGDKSLSALRVKVSKTLVQGTQRPASQGAMSDGRVFPLADEDVQSVLQVLDI